MTREELQKIAETATLDEMLLRVREERPSQTIHRVEKFELKGDYISVFVSMDFCVKDIVGKEVRGVMECILPYPLENYKKQMEFIKGLVNKRTHYH